MRDKQKQLEWRRVNVRYITGLRPKCSINVYKDDMTTTTIGPEDFIISYGPNQPAQLFSSTTKIHIPRSLCKRARITINKNTGEVIGKNAMYHANP